jgi:hypothetical protein
MSNIQTISHGREAFAGSLFLVDRAPHATKPPSPIQRGEENVRK